MRWKFAVLGSVLSLLGTTALAQAVASSPPGTAPIAAAFGTPPSATTPSPAASALPPAPEANPTDSVAALVNDAPITDYDLRQRILLFVATSGLQPTADNITKLRPKVLEELEAEQLKLQEARR